MSVKHSNKYLTFLLGDENYGLPILEVKEIIGVMQITHIPKMPEFVKGVVNLRGKIIPVVDLRLRFGLDEQEYDERTCIIVTEVQTPSGSRLNGLIVDMVSDVLDILPEDMEGIIDYGGEVNQEFFKSLGKVKDKVVMIVDSNRILSENEKQQLGMETEELHKEMELV